MQENYLKNLKHYRHIYRLTQKEIADKLNVAHTTYSNYEMGITEPNLQTLLQIADIFNVSLDALLSHKVECPDDANADIDISPIMKKIIDNLLELDEMALMRVYGYVEAISESKSKEKD